MMPLLSGEYQNGYEVLEWTLVNCLREKAGQNQVVRCLPIPTPCWTALSTAQSQWVLALGGQSCDQRKEEDCIGLTPILKRLVGWIKLKETCQRSRTNDFWVKKSLLFFQWLPEPSCDWIARLLSSWEVKTTPRWWWWCGGGCPSLFSFSLVKNKTNVKLTQQFCFLIKAGCFYVGIRYEIEVLHYA